MEKPLEFFCATHGDAVPAELVRMMRAMPDKADKYIARAVRETAKRTKARATKVVTQTYAINKRGKSYFKSQTQITKAAGSAGTVATLTFAGILGLRADAFKDKPGKSRFNFRGMSNAARRSIPGVTLKYLRAGGFKNRHPSGGKMFWARPGSGHGWFLAWRSGRGHQAKPETGLMGPSPIQALRANEGERAKEVWEYSQETLDKRVAHQINRMMQEVLK